eukprot:scaffold50494_cov64-Phaeocystis_antarctica.AAC.3
MSKTSMYRPASSRELTSRPAAATVISYSGLMTPCSRSRCAPPATLGVRPSRSSLSSAVPASTTTAVRLPSMAAPPASWVTRVRLASRAKPGGSRIRKWPRGGMGLCADRLRSR